VPGCPDSQGRPRSGPCHQGQQRGNAVRGGLARQRPRRHRPHTAPRGDGGSRAHWHAKHRLLTQGADAPGSAPGSRSNFEGARVMHGEQCARWPPHTPSPPPDGPPTLGLLCLRCGLQVEVDKPLGIKLAPSKSKGGGLVVSSVSGNAAKAGIAKGDTVICAWQLLGSCWAGAGRPPACLCDTAGGRVCPHVHQPRDRQLLTTAPLPRAPSALALPPERQPTPPPPSSAWPQTPAASSVTRCGRPTS
jgi:hypothetical protein